MTRSRLADGPWRRTLPHPVARLLTLLLLAVALCTGPWVPAAGAIGFARVSRAAMQTADVPVDTSGLGSGPYATMETLYERTIFRVNVLRLTLQFGPATTEELERLVAGRGYDAPLAESVAVAALEARDVLVRSRFLRDVSLDQYLEGIRENLGDARDAGILAAPEHEAILADMEDHYEPLRARGILSGDTMWYRVRGDRLQVSLQAEDGSIPMELTAQGSEHRRAVLGGYLAPASRFRDPLIRSLFAPAAD